MMRNSSPAERRQSGDGSVICENHQLRLRVTRELATLGLAIDARTPDGEWVVMAQTSQEGDVRYLDADGGRHTGYYNSYDPVVIDGQTCGVRLVGQLGAMHLTCTTLLHSAGPWCHHLLEIDQPEALHCRQLTQHWQAPSLVDLLPLTWPAEPAYADALVCTPVALAQAESCFLALVPDLEEGDPSCLAVHFTSQDLPECWYGVWTPDATAQPLPTPVRLAYDLCLDMRALPGRGFQQVVRQLGTREAFRLASPNHVTLMTGDLATLPIAPDFASWQPLQREGTPAEIVALVKQALRQVEHGDWGLLEDALCWLDRLCFQQYAYELPGGQPLGSVGTGKEWHAAAPWMPLLLLDAYRLTGRIEYVHRGIAALSALPAPERAVVLNTLHRRFGDVYIHADYHDVIALATAERLAAAFTPDGVELTIASSHTSPLQLVVEGLEEAYSVAVNGVPLGTVPTEQLRTGLTVPPSVLDA